MIRWFNRNSTRPQPRLTSPIKPRRARLLLQALEQRAVPAVYTVDNILTDTNDANFAVGELTLREAVDLSNASVGTTDSILFDATLFSTPQLINLVGELALTDSVTITGTSAANVSLSTGAAGRGFKIDDLKTTAITVSISKLTITGCKATTTITGGIDGGGIGITNEDVTLDGVVITGNSAAEGGGVTVNEQGGKLTVLNCTIQGNNTTGGTDGGGINMEANGASLTVRGSTISGNTAQDDGGGIYLTGVANLLIENSTIDNNKASSIQTIPGLGGGGGIYWFGTVLNGTAVVRNTTISGNMTAGGTGSGGGIQLGGIFVGNLLIQNCTITGNASALAGGGIQRFGGRGTTIIQSSIVTGNTSAVGSDIWSSFATEVSNSAIGSAAGFTMTDKGGNLPFGTSLNLGGLANNGGPTQTHLPGPGSPLVNRGANPAGLTTDQRGGTFGRVFGTTADIGAVEVDTNDATPTFFATLSQPTLGATTYTVTVVFTDFVSIDATTIGLSNVTISGLGYGGAVSPTSFTAGPSGKSVTATYTFPAPDNTGIGIWDVSDNSATPYTVAISGVTNTLATPVITGTLGDLTTRLSQTFVVTTDASSGPGSLPDAVSAANSSPNSHDSITFDPTYFATAKTIVLFGELQVSDALTIVGPGSKLATIDGGGAVRIFNISGPGAVSFNLSKITLTGALFSGSDSKTRGGAIFSEDDPVTISDSVLTGNRIVSASTLGGDGGAIAMYRGNTLTVTDTTISNNTATGGASDGGGIFVGRSGAATFTRSVISGNTSQSAGGGIYAVNSKFVLDSSTVSGNIMLGTGLAIGGGGGLYFLGGANDILIRNSTISGNFSGLSGGGIHLRLSGNYNSMLVQNSTITANSAANAGKLAGNGGGGIAQFETLAIANTIAIESSIVAGNFNASFPDISASRTVSLKNSAIGNTTGITTFVDLGGNLVGKSLTLGTLANNGGTLRTHLAGAGSLLIDAGTNPASLTLDQRGGAFPRVVGANADIGSVESTGTAPISIAGPFADIAVGGGTSYSFTVTYVGSVNLKSSTFDNADVRITGPSGFNVLATKTAVDVAGDGLVRVVTYSFVPPGGTWDGTDSGFYSIGLEPSQVQATDGAFVGEGVLGMFRVNAPAVFLVTNNQDDNSAGSLRDIVAKSNANIGQDTINFDPTVFTIGTTIGLLLGPLSLTDSVVINGLGANRVILDGAANTLSKRTFRINDAVDGRHANVVINKLAVINATSSGVLDATSRGGAVLISGDEFVTFADCLFNNNNDPAEGGGAIAHNGTAGKLTLTRTIFSNNSIGVGIGGAVRITTTVISAITDCFFDSNKATDDGGALAVSGAGLLMERTSFVNNQTTAGVTSDGAAVFFVGSPPDFGWTIRNSTFSGNSAAGRGGAIAHNAANLITIENSTITNNTATGTATDGGGGLFLLDGNGIVRLSGTIVSGNTHALGTNADIKTASGNQRLFVSTSAIGSTTGISAGTLIDLGSNLAVGAPLNLQPLAANGATIGMTHGLGAASKAIDAGQFPNSSANDGRGTGFPRVVGGRADIGAFEAATNNLPGAAVAGLPATVAAAGATTFTVVVTYTDAAAIDSTKIDVTDLTVTGPGFAVATNPISATFTGTGGAITATYTFNASDSGSWDVADNGLYTIDLLAGAVTDSVANPVDAQVVGTFRVSIGATFTVLNTADAGADSLRAAITAANASAGIDTINFDPGVFNGTATINLVTALPTISDGLVIRGVGTSAANVVINQTGVGARIFFVNGAGEFPVTFDRLTLTGGNLVAGSNGAGILLFDEQVTVTNCVISGNKAGSGGGISIAEGGSLTLLGSTLSKNSSIGTGFAVGGGALYVNRNRSNVVIQDSTISGNTSTIGAGIYSLYGGSFNIDRSTFSTNSSSGQGGGIAVGNLVTSGGFNIRNSTFSANTAATHGGGLSLLNRFSGTASIHNSTFTLNVANSAGANLGDGGGGIAWRQSVAGVVNDGALNITSSIIAGNLGTTGFKDLSTVHTVNASKNLFGIGDTGFTLTNPANLFGTKASPLNPMLDPLANNGGPTQTHALQTGSPALNTGSNTLGLTVDQRGTGFLRTSGAATDIGAYEFQAPVGPPPTATVKIDNGGVQRSMLQSLTVTFSEPVSFVGSPSAAFTVERLATSKIPTPTGFVNLVITPNGTNTVFTITFNDPVLATQVVNAKSLIDGKYAITLVANQIKAASSGLFLDGNGDTVAGDSLVVNTTRIFGDADGDGDTDNADFVAFRLALGAGPSAIFDIDGDGDVDNTDFVGGPGFIGFRQRFGQMA